MVAARCVIDGSRFESSWFAQRQAVRDRAAWAPVCHYHVPSVSNIWALGQPLISFLPASVNSGALARCGYF